MILITTVYGKLVIKSEKKNREKQQMYSTVLLPSLQKNIFAHFLDMTTNYVRTKRFCRYYESLLLKKSELFSL